MKNSDLSICAPEELALCIPYLLGYYPQDAAVLFLLRGPDDSADSAAAPANALTRDIDSEFHCLLAPNRLFLGDGLRIGFDHIRSVIESGAEDPTFTCARRFLAGSMILATFFTSANLTEEAARRDLATMISYLAKRFRGLGTLPIIVCNTDQVATVRISGLGNLDWEVHDRPPTDSSALHAELVANGFSVADSAENIDFSRIFYEWDDDVAAEVLGEGTAKGKRIGVELHNTILELVEHIEDGDIEVALALLNDPPPAQPAPAKPTAATPERTNARSHEVSVRQAVTEYMKVAAAARVLAYKDKVEGEADGDSDAASGHEQFVNTGKKLWAHAVDQVRSKRCRATILSDKRALARLGGLLDHPEVRDAIVLGLANPAPAGVVMDNGRELDDIFSDRVARPDQNYAEAVLDICRAAYVYSPPDFGHCAAIASFVYWWIGMGYQARILAQRAIEDSGNRGLGPITMSLIEAGITPPWRADHHDFWAKAGGIF